MHHLTTLPSDHPEQRSQHGDQLRAGGVGGSYSGRGKRSSHLRNHPERFKCPPKFPFLRYRGSFPGTKRSGRDELVTSNADLTTHNTHDIHAASGIRNHNLNRRATADLLYSTKSYKRKKTQNHINTAMNSADFVRPCDDKPTRRAI